MKLLFSKPIAFVVAFALFAKVSFASEKRIILCFDAMNPSGGVFDSGGENLAVPFCPGSRAEVSSDEKKFGEGSLLVETDSPVGILEVPFNEAAFEAFAGAVTKLTFSVWVRLPSSPEGGFSIAQRSYNNGSGTSGYFLFSKHSTLGLRFIATDNAPVRSTEAALHFEVGEWIHLAMSYDQGVVRFYRNGEPLPTIGKNDASEIPPLEILDKKARLRFLGGLPAGSRVDDFGIFFGSALDEAAIRDIANRGLKVFVETK